MILQDYINFENNIAILKIKATPWASKSEFFSVLDNWVLKIRIKAPAEKWKANKELINYLSKELNLSKNNFEIISGGSDQVKRVRIVR